MIMLNNAVHYIPLNLFIALNELFKQGHRTLWADAICINQSDAAEKIIQLKIMHLIYSRAEQTLIWLGPEAEDSDLAMDALREAGKLEVTMEPAGERFEDALYSLQTIDGQQPEEKRRTVEALVAFFGRPYWRRTWIIQEACLATDAVVICGSKTLQWVSLANGAYRMPGYGRDYQVEEQDFNGTYSVIRIAGIRAAYHYMPEKLPSGERGKEAIDWVAGNLRNRLDTEPGFTAVGPPSLIMALIACNYAQATEPHDKLYGLLGLARDADVIIPNPNYNTSIGQLYADVTLAVIRETGHLNAICLGKKGNMSFPDLPTWAIDASRPFGLGLTIRNWTMNTYKACGERGFELNELPKAGEHQGALTVKGFALDEVDGLGVAVDHDRGVIASTVQTTHGANVYGAPQEIVRAMLRTFVMSWGTYAIAPEWFFSAAPYTIFKAAQRDEMDPSFEPELSQWCNGTRDLEFYGKSIGQWMEEWPSYLGFKLEDHNRQYPRTPLKPSPRRGLQNLNRSSRGVAIELHQASLQKRMLVTRAGRIGLAAPEARRGDLIVILFGCNVPVIMRAREDGRGYDLIGEAFVAGCMKGETVDSLKEEEVRSFQLY